MKNKVVYILGAGFSAPLGLPVMGNFLEKSKDLYFHSPEKHPHFQDIFDMISRMAVSKNYYNTDLFNIEEILSILEMEAFLDGDKLKDNFRQYIIDVIDHFTPDISPYSKSLPGNWQDFIFGDNVKIKPFGYFISSLLQLKFGLNERTNHGMRGRDFYAQKITNNYNYGVISLNYDLVLENISKKLSNFFRSDSEIEFNRDCSPDNSDCPSLYKLHGSTDTGLIVPPTWAKGTESEIKPIWKNAYNILKDANHIRFIGYSLPVSDSYIKYLLKSAVLHSKHLKSIDVICLDGDGEVSKRYKDFISFNNFRYVNANTSDYLENIMSKTKGRIKIYKNNESVEMNKLEEAHNQFMAQNGKS